MNPEFKVLTNMGETNSRTPIIQNRFRKLTLQSPQQSNIQPKMPENTTVPQSKLATKEIVNLPDATIRSQSQVITNKLMLSTSSNALTETNFINVETEPFTNPLQVESTETEKKSPKAKSDNGELTSQMKKLEVSRVSAELFSQYSSSSRISLPPNRILSNKENIDNLSQRMSNIRMSDLADTQPNTPSQQKQRSNSTLADTQPNTASHPKQQSEHSADDERVIESIVLSSDDEDNDDGSDNLRKSLLTEESDDASVIEIESSDDSIDAFDEHVPQNKSAINAEVDELTESVALKLNNFFDNIPKLDQSRQNFYKNVESIATPQEKSETADINIPETEPSGDKNCDESNVLELEASQLDESGKTSGNDATSQISSVNENEGNEKNETPNGLLDKPDENISCQSPVLHLNESRKTSTVDNESDNQSVEDESGSSHLNQSTNEKQLSVREPKKKIEFEKIKTDAKKVITFSSPKINVSATININIQVSGFSSNSSDTDVTSENAEDPSDKSAKNDLSTLSEDCIDSSMESHCLRNVKKFSGSQSKNFIAFSPNVKATDDDLPDQDDQTSPDSSVIESSIIHSQADVTLGNPNDDKDAPGRSQSNHSLDKDSTNASISSVDIVTKQPTDGPSSSPDLVTKELIIEGTSDASLSSSADLRTKEPTDASSSSADLTKESIVDGTTKDKNTLSVTPTDTSVEIDEIGEQLLNGIYGDTWRTPQLIKKCVSTKKKYQTDLIKRGKSRGFSLFRRDIIHSELDSTRITPTGGEAEHSHRKDNLDESNSEAELTLPNKDNKVNETEANESSRIIRTRRKVAPNRILDYSDNDDSDDSDQSDQSLDDSFEPEPSEESDSSVEKLEKPEPARRKRKKFVFLDLTCNEVIEDEDHENPDATSEELEKVVENYLQSLETETVVQTPAPKKNVPSITAKRKLFTPNYDDQTPFEEETKTPEPLKQGDGKKTIQLKTPIPSFLIPPQFRDKAKIVAEPITPTGPPPPNDSKKFQTPYTPAPKQTCGFLESLDSNLIPEQHCDPEALKLRKNFKRHRTELVTRLMSIYNKYVFDNRLKDVSVSWNKKLTTTAGICRIRKIAGVRKGPVELSEKVVTSADRARDTLIHELCHAAAWVIDRDAANHGKIFKYWASRANQRFPELPAIKRCHNYDIEGKFTYKCTICGLKSKAHSKSRKVENIRCAKCHGPIEIFLNKTDENGQVILVTPKEPSMFAKYVKEKYKLHKVSGVTHADVMKILSNNFGKLTVEEKSKFK
ncbi:hypothetical protein HA402_011352 [Bradysia odoriphaga]|nr:hypothetical protein HA402_011352 [Bradysia odoriphaga]